RRIELLDAGDAGGKFAVVQRYDGSRGIDLRVPRQGRPEQHQLGVFKYGNRQHGAIGADGTDGQRDQRHACGSGVDGQFRARDGLSGGTIDERHDLWSGGNDRGGCDRIFRYDGGGGRELFLSRVRDRQRGGLGVQQQCRGAGDSGGAGESGGGGGFRYAD